MLVDELQKRADSFDIINSNKVEFAWLSNEPFLEVDDNLYKITIDALDQLLNLVKIPIKYFSRLLQNPKAEDLALNNINFWLQNKVLAFLIKSDQITEVFEGSRTFLASIDVNDAVVSCFDNPDIRQWNVAGDIFHAIYIEKNYKKGVRVLYSDSFSIVPRFDSIVYFQQTILALNISKNFRSQNVSKVNMLGQVKDFVETAIDQAELIVIAIEKINKDPILCSDYLYRLRDSLKLSLDIRNIICAGLNITATQKMDLLQLSLQINKFVHDHTELTFQQSRDIQIAVTNYLVMGHFKP